MERSVGKADLPALPNNQHGGIRQGTLGCHPALWKGRPCLGLARFWRGWRANPDFHCRCLKTLASVECWRESCCLISGFGDHSCRTYIGHEGLQTKYPERRRSDHGYGALHTSSHGVEDASRLDNHRWISIRWVEILHTSGSFLEDLLSEIGSRCMMQFRGVSF